MPVVVLSRSDVSTPWGFRLHGGKDFGSPLTVQRPTVISPSYAPKPFNSQSSYGQKLETLTNDTASLDISKKYEINDPAKWDPPSTRGVTVPPPSGYNPGTDTKKYVPSETCKLVMDMEAGHETPYNPRTGAERRPAPVQSKLMDYLEKRCGETSSNSTSPSSAWPSPPPGTGIRSTPPQSTAPGAPSTSPGYHAGAAPSNALSGAKPSGFKSASSFGADRRPSRDGKKTHLEEALSMPAFSGPNVPVCNVDGVPVKGPYVTAVNKIWCQEHFVCSNPSCNQSLADTGFVEEDGQLFCKRDYEQYFAPRCAKCDQPIVGDTVKALQKTYHPSCFSCRQCKQPIMGGLFHLEQGEPYCEKDWAAMFQSKCFGCNFPIEMGDTWIEALGQNWHAECFNCTMAVPFSNTKLRAPRGFRNILEGLSREILRSQPSDIYAFGSLYFEKLLQIRAESGIDPVEFGAQEEDRFYNNKVYARDAVLHENDKEREMAAIKIQTKYRQYTAKKVVREKREERAAVKIQACFRGHLDRKYVHGIKNAAEHVETEAKEMARVEDEEEEEKEGDSPSKIMVADFPDKRGKLEDTVMQQASALLEKKADAVSEEQQQKDEKEMAEKKEGKVEEGKEEEEEQSDEISDKEEAATRIQAGMRGMLTRMTLKGQLIPGEETATEQVEKKVEAEDEKETKEKKEDEEDKESQNDETSDMDEAATRIQAGMRGMLTRMTLKGQLIPGEETGKDEKDRQKEEDEKEESGTKEEEKNLILRLSIELAKQNRSLDRLPYTRMQKILVFLFLFSLAFPLTSGHLIDEKTDDKPCSLPPDVLRAFVFFVPEKMQHIVSGEILCNFLVPKVVRWYKYWYSSEEVEHWFAVHVALHITENVIGCLVSVFIQVAFIAILLYGNGVLPRLQNRIVSHQKLIIVYITSMIFCLIEMYKDVSAREGGSPFVVDQDRLQLFYIMFVHLNLLLMVLQLFYFCGLTWNYSSNEYLDLGISVILIFVTFTARTTQCLAPVIICHHGWKIISSIYHLSTFAIQNRTVAVIERAYKRLYALEMVEVVAVLVVSSFCPWTPLSFAKILQSIAICLMTVLNICRTIQTASVAQLCTYVGGQTPRLLLSDRP